MDLDGLKVFAPIFHNCFKSNLMSFGTYFLSIYLVVSHYNLNQAGAKDHNGNKRDHFLIVVLSFVLVSKP